MPVIRTIAEGGGWEVWLDPQAGDEAKGVCVGIGATQEGALLQALWELTARVVAIGRKLGIDPGGF